MVFHDNCFSGNCIPRASFRSSFWGDPGCSVKSQDEQSCMELKTETGNPQMSKS
jgi:hypothetical protein